MMSNKNKSIQILTKGVEFLFKKNKVTYLKGKGVLFSKNDVVVYNDNKKENYKAKNIVIATGSDVASLPGITIDEKNIISSTGALDLEALPKSVAIVGGGYIGLELGCALAKLGSKITVVEGMSSVLAIMDKEIRRPLEIWLKKHKVTVHTDSLARGVEIKGRGASKKAELTFEKDGTDHKVKVDKVLVTVGRKPNTKGWGLENTGVRMDGSGRFIRTDRQCRTSVPGVYAIGDVSGEPMLCLLYTSPSPRDS